MKNLSDDQAGMKFTNEPQLVSKIFQRGCLVHIFAKSDLSLDNWQSRGNYLLTCYLQKSAATILRQDAGAVFQISATPKFWNIMANSSSTEM